MSPLNNELLSRVLSVNVEGYIEYLQVLADAADKDKNLRLQLKETDQEHVTALLEAGGLAATLVPDKMEEFSEKVAPIIARRQQIANKRKALKPDIALPHLEGYQSPVKILDNEGVNWLRFYRQDTTANLTAKVEKNNRFTVVPEKVFLQNELESQLNELQKSSYLSVLDIVESVTPFMFSGNEYFSLVHLFNAVDQIKYLAERLAISSSTPSQMPVVKGAKKPVYRTMWGGTREQLRKILQRLTERECLTKGLPFITATVEDREAFVLLNTKRQNNDPTIPPEAPGMVWNGVNEKLYYLLVWLNRKRDPKTNKEYLGTSAKNLAVLAKSNFGLSAQVDTISTKIRNIDRNGYDEIKRREIDEILREVFGSE